MINANDLREKLLAWIRTDPAYIKGTDQDGPLIDAVKHPDGVWGEHEEQKMHQGRRV